MTKHANPLESAQFKLKKLRRTRYGQPYTTLREPQRVIEVTIQPEWTTDQPVLRVAFCSIAQLVQQRRHPFSSNVNLMRSNPVHLDDLKCSSQVPFGGGKGGINRRSFHTF